MLLFCYVFCYHSMITSVMSAVWFIDGRSSSCVCQRYFSLWNISIFRCEPWLFIRMNWDSPWYLIELVADCTIMYDAYSTLIIWSMVWDMPELVSVACSSIFTSELWKGWVVTEPVSLSIAVASFLVRLWVLVRLLTNPYVNLSVVDVCFELSYWPARSFSRASHGCASSLCQWVLVYGWLMLT